MKELISKTTQNNWKRLKKNKKNKLTSRANKRKSTKKIIPLEYVSNKENLTPIIKLLDVLKQNSWKNEDIIYSLAISIINHTDISTQSNVKNFLEEYSSLHKIPELISYDISSIQENDILGMIYQCLLSEGEKNRKGSYYTPKSVTENMTKDLNFSNEQTFLDPCCGSGSFLLAVDVKNPEQIYGVDNDKIAVMIAKINLIIKYKGIEFSPHIYQRDFLTTSSKRKHKKSELERKFTYIVTNPPWGGMTKKEYIPHEIKSGEIFSCFIVKSYEKLEQNGKMRFLLPISVLNVKTHRDIREFILNHGNLSKITLYDNTFTGVTTKYVDLEIENNKQVENVIIDNGKTTHVENKENFRLTKNSVFTIINPRNEEIIRKIQGNGRYYLTDSKWALGIVTGDNKDKLSDKLKDGYEAVYTGKEIASYHLQNPKKYLKYDRDSFQQVAKDEYYRASEKLVYKFISNKLVFAYDDNKSLFLNSANILIPNIPNMSIKTAMAYLNSEIFSYYYRNLFGEIKILKGNLMEIPFPNITEEEDKRIANMVNDIMEKRSTDEALQQEIYQTYQLDDDEIEWIKGEMKQWKY